MAENSDFPPDLQPSLQRDAPDLDVQTTGPEAARCTKCGRAVDEDARRTGHCPKPCGAFVWDNPAAKTHGGRQLQLRGPVDALARLRYDDVRAGLLSDSGDTPSMARAIVVDRLAEATLLAEVTWTDMVINGVLTAKGRRRAVVDLYLAASDRAARLAGVVGLERRCKDLSMMTPQQWIESQEREHEQDAGAPTMPQEGAGTAAEGPQQDASLPDRETPQGER
jgi:hypothetical protein